METKRRMEETGDPFIRLELGHAGCLPDPLTHEEESCDTVERAYTLLMAGDQVTGRMFYYFIAHVSHHISRWLPRTHKPRLLVTVTLLGVALTVPQVYVLLRPSSSRFCSQPLLDNLICNIGFTLFATAFALILILVEPLPSWLKSLFHTFGAASFIEGICTVLMTSLATECAVSTPALYYVSVVLSALSVLSTVFFLIVGPFWLSNSIFPEMVLSKESRTGICYEVVTCCPCTWHI